jgi:hypothetical protein
MPTQEVGILFLGRPCRGSPYQGLAPLFIISFFLSFHDANGDADAQLVQKDQGQCYDGLAHPVRRRGDNSCDEKDGHIGVFPVYTEEPGCDEADAGQYVAYQGQLKGQPRAYNNIDQVLDIIIQGRNGPDRARSPKRIVIQKAESKGRQEEISEGDSHQEEKADPPNGSPAAFQLFRGKGGFYETPKFPEYIGKGDDKAADDGNVDAGDELGAELGGLQLEALYGLQAKCISHMQLASQVAQADITHEIVPDRASDDNVKDPVHLYEEHNGYYNNSEGRPDNMPA